jgi:hypothetical protein
MSPTEPFFAIVLVILPLGLSLPLSSSISYLCPFSLVECFLLYLFIRLL